MTKSKIKAAEESVLVEDQKIAELETASGKQDTGKGCTPSLCISGIAKDGRQGTKR